MHLHGVATPISANKPYYHHYYYMYRVLMYKSMDITNK